MQQLIRLVIAAALSLALLPACTSLDPSAQNTSAEAQVTAASAAAPVAEPTPEAVAAATAEPASVSTPSGSSGPAIEEIFARVYEEVNPSVVAIQVTQDAEVAREIPEVPGFPFEFEAPPPGRGGPQGQPGGSLGSGFVWDDQGHIVTNNHVVAGGGEIAVVFADGAVTSAEVIGTDLQSDLAVVKVDPAAHPLIPVAIGDSTELRVGELAIAIGNPFGEQSTMTTGIISALGRQLPAGQDSTSGPVYTIPDIIQTDAAINPGNSGGVLLDDQGRLIGVPTAILSPSGTNAGVGYAVPSVIVRKVVPALIEDGSYAHPWLGISGATLVPDLAEAMNLSARQRGALVVTVAPGSPAAEVGLRPSEQQVTVEGVEARVGGDLITAVDGEPVEGFDDLVTYLARNAAVGDRVTLTVLRDGQEEEVQVTLAARPGDQGQAGATGVQLGIQALSVTPDVARSMGLDESQQGVLVGQILAGSPADEAGLRGSDTTATINGQRVMVGGDIITAVDGTAVASVEELRRQLEQAGADGVVTLSILRDGERIEREVTFGENGDE
jgi:serine protease Do